MPGELFSCKDSIPYIVPVSQPLKVATGMLVPAPDRWLWRETADDPQPMRLECRPGTQDAAAWPAPLISVSCSSSLRARWQDPSPAHAKLARAAHCHRNSVGNALHRLRDLGLMTWERQTLRVHGWRLQVANRYLFMSNASLPPARTRPVGKGRKLSALIASETLCSGGRPLLPVRSVQEQLRLLGMG